MLRKIKDCSKDIKFATIIDYIDAYFDFEPCAFLNGTLENAAGQNSGSNKVFQFGILEKLNKEQTLACFGEYYQIEVLGKPDETNHQNIRNFMEYGFDGLKFETLTLRLKE